MNNSRWLPAAAFWTCVGLVFALPSMADDAGWRAPLIQALTQWWAWGLLAPLAIAVDRRLPFSSAQTVLRMGTHVVLGVVFSAVQVYMRAALAAPFALASGQAPWEKWTGIHLFTSGSGEGILWSMLVYGLIVGGWWAYESHGRVVAAELRMERIERSATEARLNALRLQLDPHFLFNTLNTISSQVQAEPKLARQMIEHLGDLLRLSLDPNSRNEITLAEELAFLDLYLAIQAIRFGDKLRVTRHIADDVRGAAVPSMVLQPLVENAIRHGISRRAAGGAVAIAAHRDVDDLVIAVRDNGVGLAPHRTDGLGLRLTRERIAGFHADGATSLTITDHADSGALVTLRFPLHLMEANRAAA